MFHNKFLQNKFEFWYELCSRIVGKTFKGGFMKQFNLIFIISGIFSMDFLLSSDQSDCQEKSVPCAEEQAKTEQTSPIQWRKVFEFLRSDLYEGTQELPDGTVINLIARSLEEKEMGGRRRSISESERVPKDVPFQQLALIVPIRRNLEEKAVVVQKESSQATYPDSVWL